jgi:MFS family permease
MRSPGVAQGVVLLLPCIMAVMGVLALAPVVPKMIEAFSGTPHIVFWVNTILTVPSLCLMLFSPLMGLAGDRFGRRRLLIAALFAYAAFGIAPLFLDSLWAILATRVCVGIAEAGVLTLSTTLLGDLFKGEARDRWLGMQMAVASIGAILCLVAGGALGSFFGWRGPFAVYGLAAVLGLAITLLIWEPKRTIPTDISQRLARAQFPWRAMLGICAITVFASILVYTWQIEVGMALTALGMRDPEQIGFYTAIVSLATSVGTLLFQSITRVSVAKLLTVEFLILGISYCMLSGTRDPSSFLIISAVNQMGAGMLMPTLLTWAVRQLSFEVRGRGTGIWQGAFSVGQFCAGLLIPVTISLCGGVIASYKVLGVGALVFSAGALLATILTKPPAVPTTLQKG